MLSILESQQAAEAKARRMARRAGLVAKKSRWHRGTVDNLGGFMLIEPDLNYVIAGERFNLSPQDVIDYCNS